MASDVDIANSCFYKIGNNTRITAFDDGSAAANFASERYAELRDDLLRSHTWNFSLKRVQLAQASTGPTFPTDYNFYTLPSDCIRPVRAFDNDAGVGKVDYRVEDGKIMAGREELWLLYVAEVTDPNDMTPDFRECLALSMAVEAAISLASSRLLSERMEARLDKKLMQARSVDAISDGPRELPKGTWVTQRFRGVGQVVTTD